MLLCASFLLVLECSTVLNMHACVCLQWGGVRVVPAGPRLVLHQFNVAAAAAHHLSHQDMGSGAADPRWMTSPCHTNAHKHTQTGPCEL